MIFMARSSYLRRRAREVGDCVLRAIAIATGKPAPRIPSLS